MKVCSLVFVSWCLLILGPTWLLFMMDIVLSCASGQDRSELVLSCPAEGSWSFHLLQQTLFLLSFLCFFRLNGSVQFPLSPPHHGFSLPRPLCHLTLCLLHFHFQHSAAHTPFKSDLQNTCKSAGWPKSLQSQTFWMSSRRGIFFLPSKYLNWFKGSQVQVHDERVRVLIWFQTNLTLRGNIHIITIESSA